MTASYKSPQRERSKESDASESTAEELASDENSLPDKMSAIQALSAFAHPVTKESEFLQERSSPNFTARLHVLPTPPTSNMAVVDKHVNVAFCGPTSDSAACLAGSYHGFRSSDDTHRSLDSTYPPALTLKDVMPQYFAQHSFSAADGPSTRSLRASSDAVNPVITVFGQVTDTVTEQNLKAAYGAMSEESAHNYDNVSGITLICLIRPLTMAVKVSFFSSIVCPFCPSLG